VSASDALLHSGEKHQQAGRLDLAEQIYRQVLAAEPSNAKAWHLLAILAIAGGALPTAVELLTEAIRRAPREALFHATLGEAYQRLGDTARALASLRQAASLQPDLPEVQVSLGLLYRAAGEWQLAVACFAELVRLSPGVAQARALLGQALLNLSRVDEAEQEFRQALSLAPQDARAHYNLATVLQSQGHASEAAESYQTAIRLDPTDAEEHNNLGSVLHILNRASEAETYYRQAVALDANHGPAAFNLGALLVDQRRYEEGIGWLRRAALLSPDRPEVFMRLAVALHKVDLLDEAIVRCQRVLELDPAAAAAHNTLASCHQLLGRPDEAVRAFREAVRLAPESAALHSNLLYALNYLPDLSATDVFTEHRQWAARHADPLTSVAAELSPRSNHQRLRLGYVSAHFKDHAVNYFVEPILAAHDHERFEVFCYSSALRTDATTERLRGHADHWRESRDLVDEAAAQVVRDDQIDVLVDLDGHIGGNRLTMFARRPAPVQATYIGYQNTTGMAAMDYRITDDWSDPPGETDSLHIERLVRLPDSFFCYQPSTDAPPITDVPAVTRGYVTFGSFNNFAKITPQVLATWAELLHAVPTARLTMLVPVTESSRRYLEESFAAHGIAPERIELCRRRPRGDYLHLINQVDVALDPFPFNGHTTTCDCLWQGVPVVTWAGETYVSRFGSSAHRSLGLLDLVADSRENYLTIAAGLAGDVDRLVELRGTLRDRMAASVLLDHVSFTRGLEDAYRAMLERAGKHLSA